MHRLVIRNVGPVTQCELECCRFMTFTGFQASGKSTIAKAVYYFRTIKDDIVQLIQKQAFDVMPVEGLDDEYDAGQGISLEKRLKKYLCRKFYMTFGLSGAVWADMRMDYYFTPDCRISVSQDVNAENQSQDRLCIVFSGKLAEFLRKKNKSISADQTGMLEHKIKSLKAEIYQFFNDPDTVVYIPAGRSMLTLLSQQFSYIYATMDDHQKRSLDLCTRDYLERVLRVKPEFADGWKSLTRYSKQEVLPPEMLTQAFELMKKILRGTYRCKNGEEQIVLDHGNYVKINFSSSGQQECVWILNLLLYYLLQQKQMLFIIEEPESHLFPEAQKYITELIALVSNADHSMVLTTHSPYVLGTLNNLLYAHTISRHQCEKAGEILPEFLWLDPDSFQAWFVKNGTIENCMDSEIPMIQNERIDEISKVINDDFDRLLELQNMDEEDVVPKCL